MQSTDIPLIKAALRDHAFLGSPLVCCPMGRVVAVRERKGQLLAMIRGWGVRWYAVPSITIEEKLTTRRSRWRNEIHIQHQIFAQNILKRDHTGKCPECSTQIERRQVQCRTFGSKDVLPTFDTISTLESTL